MPDLIKFKQKRAQPHVGAAYRWPTFISEVSVDDLYRSLVYYQDCTVNNTADIIYNHIYLNDIFLTLAPFFPGGPSICVR